MSKTIASLCLGLFVSVAAMNAIGAPPDTQPVGGPVRTVKGRLAITGTGGGRITAAALNGADGVAYNLEMDPAGEDLARVMFGQQVQIVGVVSERQGKQWLRATGFAEEKWNQAHELWRRSRCNACAVQRGAEHAAEPKDLHGATAVTGRLYPYKQLFRSMTRDDKFLWLATDSLIYQVDLGARKLVKTYDRTNWPGLDDQPLLQIASDGQTLWILSRGQAAALTIGQDQAKPLADVHCKFATLLVDQPGAWIVADNGTYRYIGDDKLPTVLPALPTGKRMAAEIDKGMWLPFWKQNTAFYMREPVAINDRLFVESFGDIYELADGAWTKLIAGGSQQQACKGRWALTAAGVVEYDPQTKARKTYKPEEIADGRLTGLLVTDTDVWVTAEPIATPKADQPGGGGVGRMSLATGAWQCWKKIDGLDAVHAVVQLGQDGAVWVTSHQGKYQKLIAHPGMAYVEKLLFSATGFALHRWDPVGAGGAWQTTPLAYVNVEKRLVCGQDGEGSDVEIGPQNIDRLCIGPDRIFAVTRLVPAGVFSGYWPSVNPIAVRGEDGKWVGKFEHHPEQEGSLDLQGEQPLVLNISNKGEMILEAVGHDNVLDLFIAGNRPWAVTEGCVAWFDSDKGGWQKIVELGYNFNWRPTAILDEGDAVFIGSDRGLVSRLDLTTGRCQIIGGLKDRTVARLVRRDGRLLVAGGPATLGQLPTLMPGRPDLLDADFAAWDGKDWKPAAAADLPPQPGQPESWQFKPIIDPAKPPPPFIREQMIGNMLWGPGGDDAKKLVPRYYVKEIYAPRFLDFGAPQLPKPAAGDPGLAGQRMWLSEFTGLMRVNLPR